MTRLKGYTVLHYFLFFTYLISSFNAVLIVGGPHSKSMLSSKIQWSWTLNLVSYRHQEYMYRISCCWTTVLILWASTLKYDLSISLFLLYTQHHQDTPLVIIRPDDTKVGVSSFVSPPLWKSGKRWVHSLTLKQQLIHIFARLTFPCNLPYITSRFDMLRT